AIGWWWRAQPGGGRADDSGRGAGEEEPPVGICLREGRAEPPVAQRERLAERVVEGQVALVPITHRDVGTCLDEAVVAPVGPRGVAADPILTRHCVELTR